jgi:acetyltransferase EpsM
VAEHHEAWYVVGLGGQARVVASIARAAGHAIAGFLDALEEPEPGQSIGGITVAGGLSFLRRLDRPSVALAVGDNVTRGRIAETIRQINPGAVLVSPIHPRSSRESDVSLGSQVTLCLQSVLCTEVQVGDGVLVNTGAIVDHEGVLGDYCHIGPGARLAGRVHVGEFTQIGIGATVIEKVRIGHHVMVGAGAVVLRDLPDQVTAVGVPARIIGSSPESGR